MYFCVGPQLQLSQVEEGSSARGEKKSAPSQIKAQDFCSRFCARFLSGKTNLAQKWPFEKLYLSNGRIFVRK
jgi:hypothetical protein